MNEFQFLDDLKARYALKMIGDDCAVLPKDADADLLLTTDMLIEDIDFRLEWTTPELLGHKSLAVSLSDIAAMGGEPKWAMLSLGIPKQLWESDFVDEFYSGWFAVADEFNVELVGGDLSRSPDKLVIDSIAGGEVSHGKALLRSRARPGNSIYVTGSLGGAAGGLKLLQTGLKNGNKDQDFAAPPIKNQLAPQPQLLQSKLLQKLDIVSAMIDLSDGLSSDLRHVCDASGVGAKIYADRLPIDVSLRSFFQLSDCLEMALNGGEDFELLFTVDPKDDRLLTSPDVTCIGEITANTGVIELIQENSSKILESGGFMHFLTPHCAILGENGIVDV